MAATGRRKARPTPEREIEQMEVWALHERKVKPKAFPFGVEFGASGKGLKRLNLSA